MVTVRDTVAPSMSLALDHDALWPPNHSLVPVRATWQASDLCDSAPGVGLASVTSNEPDDAPGDGDGRTTGDIAGVEPGSPALEFSLRAERAGIGPGRTYQVEYTARDSSGNHASALATVIVPHDLGEGPEPLLLRLEPNGAAGGARVYWSAIRSATAYDVIAGDLAAITFDHGTTLLGGVQVMSSGQGGTSFSEASAGWLPQPGHVIYYLVQSRDEEGRVSGFGTESAPWPGEVAASAAGASAGAGGARAHPWPIRGGHGAHGAHVAPPATEHLVANLQQRPGRGRQIVVACRGISTY
ncbi:MAG: hypothetical protein DMF50_11870 [Acidobacteria bacterium]|nr:MAG: hypothetical protein DMF50_11870 [Acidobacteriota bacterium]